MDDEILQEFLAESWENLGRLDTEIVQLERSPKDGELISSIFRTIHTIKGTCGFLGLTRLGHVAHSTENVLGRLRDCRLEVSPPAISLVLDGIDRIKELLTGLEEAGQEPELDSQELVRKLDLLASLGDPPPAVDPVAFEMTTEELVEISAEDTAADPAEATSPPATFNNADGEPRPGIETDKFPFDSDLELRTAVANSVQFPSPASLRASEPNGAAVNRSSGAEADVKANAATPIPAATPIVRVPTRGVIDDNDVAPSDTRKSVADLSIRVNVDVLDLLMNLVGELVLTRNQLLQLVRGEDESRYSAPIALLNRVTTDLQEGVMKTRMQPIGNAWSKLPRLVRDLCQVTSKQVELEMLGAETELDRTVLDAIKDPLTHMVRNSLDHGIESPAVRRKLGKPEQGLLRLKAYHEGGHVIICIEDNGRGIDRPRVLKKALDQGLVSELEAANLSDGEIDRLIFRPGFSTAEQVTAVSGRGVGMDVVRTEIERIGGTVELSSVTGQGTVIRIKIPLTLAIISALVVESGGIHFAIPQLGVVELVRIPGDERHRIERIRDQQVFRLRDRLLPLIELSETLQLPGKSSESDDDVYIVVVQVGEEQLGLIVSEVFDTQEIVVKPVGRLLKDVTVYQGTTILGDGRVIMILDVAGIAGRFGKSRVDQLSGVNERPDPADTIAPTTLLLFHGADGQVQAVPLSLVSRLEEFPSHQIELSGQRMLVQYRGQLLPLVHLAGTPASHSLREVQPVIVFSDGTNALGLLVDQIRDILEAPLEIRNGTQRPGALGTAIVDGKATDIIDTQFYLAQVNPQWFRRERRQSPARLLVVIESLFFRQLVRTACEASGFRPTVVESLARAEDQLDHGGPFEAVICDADVTDERLLAFHDWARRGADSDARFVLAMTGVDCPDHRASLIACGCDEVMTKFDAQQLTALLKSRLNSRPRLTGAAT